METSRGGDISTFVSGSSGSPDIVVVLVSSAHLAFADRHEGGQ